MAKVNPVHTPRISDAVHYRSALLENPGCKAAIVSDIHPEPNLASLVVINGRGIQFVDEVEHAEREHPWEEYPPGTWHRADHL